MVTKRSRRNAWLFALVAISIIICISSLIMVFAAETTTNSVTEPAFIFENNAQVDISVQCENRDLGGYCSPSATCNITIDFPNGTHFVDNQQMTNYISSYNITVNHTIEGEYWAKGICIDVNQSKSFSFPYLVNPIGIRPSSERTDTITRSIYFIFGIGIILFLGFLFVRESVPVRWTFFIVAFTFFLIGINLIFVSLQDEIVNPRLETFFDVFAAISFYGYWFAGGLLAVLWLFTFFNTWFYKKNAQQMQKYGGL